MGAEGGFLTKQHLNECILRSPWSEYPLAPLHRACRDGDIQSLTYLVIQGDRLGVFRAINEPDQFLMWTPGHWAAYFGKLPCLKRLQQSGYSLDVAEGRLKQTVAHLAAFAGHVDVLHWLLENGVSLDKQDSLGETVVHKAVRGGSVECLTLLQHYGAPMNVPNSSQQLPYDVANSLGHEQCLQYFRAALSSPSGTSIRASKRCRDDEEAEGHGFKRARTADVEGEFHLEYSRTPLNLVPSNNTSTQDSLIAMMEANGQYPVTQPSDAGMDVAMDECYSGLPHYPENPYKCLALCGHLQ